MPLVVVEQFAASADFPIPAQGEPPSKSALFVHHVLHTREIVERDTRCVVMGGMLQDKQE